VLFGAFFPFFLERHFAFLPVFVRTPPERHISIRSFFRTPLSSCLPPRNLLPLMSALYLFIPPPFSISLSPAAAFVYEILGLSFSFCGPCVCEFIFVGVFLKTKTPPKGDPLSFFSWSPFKDSYVFFPISVCSSNCPPWPLPSVPFFWPQFHY